MTLKLRCLKPLTLCSIFQHLRSTPQEIGVDPKNRPIEKENQRNHLLFLGSMLMFPGVRGSSIGQPRIVHLSLQVAGGFIEQVHVNPPASRRLLARFPKLVN